MAIFDQVKLLHDSELHGDLKSLGSILLGMSEHNPDVLSAPHKYQVMVYYGDALYHTDEQKKAEGVYRKALQLKKMLNKTKGKTQQVELISEMELKYKVHQCHCQMKQYAEAINVLESISSKQRNAKINMALAKLHHKAGTDRSAITAYKEVLRECPMALDAAQGLLSLSVKGAEVASLMMNSIPGMANVEWLSSWIKANAFARCREYTSAIATFKLLDSKSLLRDNIDVLSSLGEVHFLNGDYNNATQVLQRAHAEGPLVLRNMDILSYLLFKEKKTKELETLSTQLLAVTEKAPEPWVALGYYCIATRKTTRAVYFAQKAYTLDNRNTESLLLKGSALLELKKIQEAILHYREALRVSPHRYEAHKGLVDCYMASHRTREAITYAAHAYKQLGTNARSLTLYGSVLAKDQLSIEKAKTYLEKAMKHDPSYLEPVYIMAEILNSLSQFDKGIELIRKVLRNHSTCRLHQLLADFLTQTNDHQEALDQYSIALSLDPSNTRAREGMERVEKQSDLGIDTPFNMEVEDMEGSDNDADLEGSDLESPWSETEFS